MSSNANTKYRNSVFSLLFSEPAALRELYSAIEGRPLDADAVITINTLQNVLFMEQYNDISFTVDNKLVILIEHQSTINPNMPLRLLLYIARVYEKIIDRKSLYRETKLSIPRPEFIVLYNGEKPFPDQKTLKLSEAFEAVKDMANELELTITAYNINKGHNENILQKSETLNGYSTFIEKIREHRKKLPLDEAMKAAVKYCVEHRILSKFLLENSSEVMNMVLTDWNIDDAKEVWQEEARQEGLEETAKRALVEGLPVDLIHNITGLPVPAIEKLSLCASRIF
jgi:hypothetical protein